MTYMVWWITYDISYAWDIKIYELYAKENQPVAISQMKVGEAYQNLLH
jgi:hypothetical protein